MYEADPSAKPGRVIIPYGRSVMALVVAQSLAQKGVEVIGCDSVYFHVLSFSKHVKEDFIYPDPEKDEEAFLDFMLEKIEHYRPSDGRPYVLMPIYRDVQLFAKHRGRFPDYIKIAAPDYEAIDKLESKDRFAETVEELDVSAPKTWRPEDDEAFADLLDDLPFPILIKPYDQAGGRGIHTAQNKSELKQLWHDNKQKYQQESLLQEVVEGQDYCFAGLFDDGVCKAGMAYRNVHKFPAESGAGILRETVECNRLQEIAQDLMGPLKWNGVAEFDFLWNGEEDMPPKMIEVNTRFWSGVFQTVKSGIDFPWLLYELTVSGHVENAPAAKIGTRTKMPYIWLYSALQDVFSDNEELEDIERRGQLAWQRMKDGHIIQGVKEYSQFLYDHAGESLNFPKKMDKIRKAWKQGEGAHDELLNEDDPYVAFGLLFILGSLIRHGELPQEIRH